MHYQTGKLASCKDAASQSNAGLPAPRRDAKHSLAVFLRVVLTASNEPRFFWFVGMMNHKLLWLVSPDGALNACWSVNYKDAALGGAVMDRRISRY